MAKMCYEKMKSSVYSKKWFVYQLFSCEWFKPKGLIVLQSIYWSVAKGCWVDDRLI